jgi:hypothetical protein
MMIAAGLELQRHLAYAFTLPKAKYEGAMSELLM